MSMEKIIEAMKAGNMVRFEKEVTANLKARLPGAIAVRKAEIARQLFKGEK